LKVSTPGDWWRIRYEEIELGSKLGAGGFGIVYKGTWHDQPVAIKMLQRSDAEDKQIEEFEREAELMINLKPHENVLRLCGVSRDPDKPMAIVLEFCDLGSLRDLLDSAEIKISFLEVIQIAEDIAKGVQHLHSENIYHRDLSARNILVKEIQGGKWQCKVADFGLSRFSQQEITTTKSDTGPLKWMSPESLLEKKYSAFSDTWGYGVTLWEILTRKEPYEELDNVQAASEVMHRGLKPKPPESCPLKLAELMNTCFEMEPTRRPNFKHILTILEEVEADVKANPFY